MSSYNAYTGTYTIKNGETRTMTFVRGNDLPSSMFEGKSRPKQTGTGHEVVYDVNAKGFRTFNWATVQGSVKQKTIQFSFDSQSS
jgi:hypothetical protein